MVFTAKPNKNKLSPKKLKCTKRQKNLIWFIKILNVYGSEKSLLYLKRILHDFPNTHITKKKTNTTISSALNGLEPKALCFTTTGCSAS